MDKVWDSMGKPGFDPTVAPFGNLTRRHAKFLSRLLAAIAASDALSLPPDVQAESLAGNNRIVEVSQVVDLIALSGHEALAVGDSTAAVHVVAMLVRLSRHLQQTCKPDLVFAGRRAMRRGTDLLLAGLSDPASAIARESSDLTGELEVPSALPANLLAGELAEVKARYADSMLLSSDLPPPVGVGPELGQNNPRKALEAPGYSWLTLPLARVLIAGDIVRADSATQRIWSEIRSEPALTVVRESEIVQSIELPDLPSDYQHLCRVVLSTINHGRRCDLRHRVARIAVAAAAFHRAHDRYPDRLAELVPDYLAQVPDDPYDGQPIRYKVVETGAILYSVGGDLIDQEGSMRQEYSDGRDSDVAYYVGPVWKSPPPPRSGPRK